MAEMTAAQARQLLQNPFDKRPRLLEIWSDKMNQIAALIEQQAQEIERMNKSLQYEQHRTGRQGTHAEGCYKWGPGHWDCAMREIAKRGRMIEQMRDICSQAIIVSKCRNGEICDNFTHIRALDAMGKAVAWLEKEAEESK